MKYRAYPKYKPSGVEWLGEVPEYWVVLRSDAILDTERKQVPTEVFAGKEVFHYSIPAIQEFGTGIVENGEDVESAKQAITEPVVLVSRLNPRKATICRAEPKEQITIASTEFVALKSTKCHLRFLEYLVSSENFRQRLDSWVQSVTRSHQRVSPEHIYRFWSAWPDVPEQRAIADFLDRETAKLDTLVAKKRELIEKLKEKRTALISRTVTRGLPPEPARAAGLNPQPKLKPSGIEWLGEVPEHWEIKRLGHLVSKVGSGKTPKGGAETYQEEGVMLIRSQNVYDDGLRLEDIVFIDEAVDEEMAVSRVLPGDVLLNITGASLGRCAIVPSDFSRANVNQHVCILRPETSKVHGRFVQRIISSMTVQSQIFSFENGSSREGLNFQQIRSLLITLPPPSEQRALAGYLDRETAKIDQMAAKVEEAIARLQEYRTALITAAVTGKIEVREAE